jgi:glycosyltransferase involved in cell wall biosynthesis
LLDHMIFAEDTARDRRAAKFIAYMLRYLDRMALGLAEIIILDTAEHEKLVPPGLRNRSVVVPIGAPELWLASDVSRIGEETENAETLRIVFFGLFTPLQGIETIARSFLILKERGIPFSVTMVGRGQDYSLAREMLGELKEISWIDWLDETELLACVSKHHVCLGIFGSNAKSQRVVPQKLFLGAAAGCVVVTSDTPPQRRMFQDHAYYVKPGDANGLADTLARMALDPGKLSEQRLATQAFARESFHPGAITMTLHEKLQHFHEHD